MCTYKTEAAELSLYIDNTPELHRQCHAVYLTLARRVARNAYDPSKAPAAFVALAAAAAQSYCTAYANGPDDASRVFPGPARATLADIYARRFDTILARMLYDDLDEAAASILRAIPARAPPAKE